MKNAEQWMGPDGVIGQFNPPARQAEQLVAKSDGTLEKKTVRVAFARDSAEYKAFAAKLEKKGFHPATAAEIAEAKRKGAPAKKPAEK